MKVDEVKLDSTRLFDSFGFGSVTCLLLYLFFYTHGISILADGVDLSQVPSAVSFPIVAVVIFTLHLLGRAVIFLGFMASRTPMTERLRAEYQLTTVNYDFAAHVLGDFRTSLRFIEGVLGLSFLSSLLLGVALVLNFFKLVDPNVLILVGWSEFGIAFGVFLGALIWHGFMFRKVKFVLSIFLVTELRDITTDIRGLRSRIGDVDAANPSVDEAQI
jgi:hypothetical protein